MSPTLELIELKNQQTLLAGSVLNVSDDFVDVGNADAPEFNDPLFGEKEVPFFE